MTHLTDVELVDLLDGTLAPARARHLDACETCRASASAIRETLSRAADAEIPEPSPALLGAFLGARAGGSACRVGGAVRMVRLGTERYGEMGHVGRATDAGACRRRVASERAASVRPRLRDLSRPPPAPVLQTPTHLIQTSTRPGPLSERSPTTWRGTRRRRTRSRGTRSRRKALASGLARSSTRWWR